MGKGNEISVCVCVPVGFVPLHCFCVSPPPPPPPPMPSSYDSGFSNKKQSYIALGHFVLFTVPVLDLNVISRI